MIVNSIYVASHGQTLIVVLKEYANDEVIVETQQVTPCFTQRVGMSPL